MPQSATYDFLGTSGSLTSPALPVPISFAGQIGAGGFTVTMDTMRTVFDTAADGTIMPTRAWGNSGQVSIEMQQTSELHAELLNLYNLLIGGPPTNWAANAMTLYNATLGNGHVLTGVCFEKKPDKPYHAQGSRVTWVLKACDVSEYAAL
jgi:Protein of unknown function (DUF3277)